MNGESASSILVSSLSAGMVSLPTMFFAPFVILYGILLFLLLGVVFLLLQIGVINYALTAIGLSPNEALLALLTV